jgi:hypothetical protein
MKGYRAAFEGQAIADCPADEKRCGQQPQRCVRQAVGNEQKVGWQGAECKRQKCDCACRPATLDYVRQRSEVLLHRTVSPAASDDSLRQLGQEHTAAGRSTGGHYRHQPRMKVRKSEAKHRHRHPRWRCKRRNDIQHENQCEKKRQLNHLRLSDRLTCGWLLERLAARGVNLHLFRIVANAHKYFELNAAAFMLHLDLDCFALCLALGHRDCLGQGGLDGFQVF